MDKKKKEKEDWDDGRVIAPMDDVGPAWKRRKKYENLTQDVTKEEKRAMTKALFAVMLPRIIVVLLGFAITFLLIYFWLK